MTMRTVFNLLDKYGATRQLERLDTPGPATVVSVPMMERRSEETPLAGDVSQYNIQFFVRHDSLTAAGFPVPARKGDRVIDGQEVYTLYAVEDMHDGTGAIGAYRMWARGH